MALLYYGDMSENPTTAPKPTDAEVEDFAVTVSVTHDPIDEYLLANLDAFDGPYW